MAELISRMFLAKSCNEISQYISTVTVHPIYAEADFTSVGSSRTITNRRFIRNDVILEFKMKVLIGMDIQDIMAMLHKNSPDFLKIFIQGIVMIFKNINYTQVDYNMDILKVSMTCTEIERRDSIS